MSICHQPSAPWTLFHAHPSSHSACRLTTPLWPLPPLLMTLLLLEAGGISPRFTNPSLLRASGYSPLSIAPARSNSSLVCFSTSWTALAPEPPMLRTPSWPLRSIKENMGRSIVFVPSSCLRRDVDPVWLKCSDGARPSVLPEASRVLRENFRGRQ